MKLPESLLAKMPGGKGRRFAPVAVLLVIITTIGGIVWGWVMHTNKDSAVSHTNPLKFLDQGCTACGMG